MERERETNSGYMINSSSIYNFRKLQNRHIAHYSLMHLLLIKNSNFKTRFVYINSPVVYFSFLLFAVSCNVQHCFEGILYHLIFERFGRLSHLFNGSVQNITYIPYFSR